ncbi:MAG: amidohydrolase family protein [Acidimicrobiales bacterium]|nr:amidohydrolase family protein [Acidimicrobiales bacterium]
MAHDLVIRAGTVVDGTGAPARTADVAIDGDRITAVGDVPEGGRRELDAEGRVVTPGFVDIHTHLDAQIAWDPLGTSSCWHGVTSVVLGNCGVTFAPCRPEDRSYLAELMESVEDIPAASILSGLPWDWVTYGEYLDSLERLPKGLNVGGMVGHCAVRHHVMGERGLDEAPATADDVAAIAAVVDEAIAAGALGFSTSRTLLHRVPDGRPVPGTWAATDELFAIGDVLGRRRAGVFEVAPRFEKPGTDFENTRAEVHWMAEVARRSGRPVTFGIAQSDLGPTLYRRIYDFVDAEAAGGGLVRPQTTPRGIAIMFGLAARTPFDRAPAWRALRDVDLAGRLAAVRDPERRARLEADARDQLPPLDWAKVFVLATEPADYAFTAADSLAAHAERAGEDVVTAFLRISDETGGRAAFSFPFLNQQPEAVEWMLAHPSTVLGLADSGAHVGQIMDAGQPTWFLASWVRDRGLVSLEDGVRRLTSDTARLFGLDGRGVLAPGAYADVNVIDVDALALELPRFEHDFPGGAGRFVQRASGYDATVVNGRVFLDRGEPTGELAGVVLRSHPS